MKYSICEAESKTLKPITISITLENFEEMEAVAAFFNSSFLSDCIEDSDLISIDIWNHFKKYGITKVKAYFSGRFEESPTFDI